MKRIFSTLALALLLAGCGSTSDDSDAPATTTAVTSTASTTSTSASPTSTTSGKDTTSETATQSTTSAPPPVAEPQPEVVATEPIFSSPGVGYQCGGTDAWVYDPANCVAANLGSDPAYDTMFGPGAARAADDIYQDLSQVPVADGGTCAAAVCGYGTNSQGERNPSSGEIQTLHGCQDGYINDPELCGAVAWVENHQY